MLVLSDNHLQWMAGVAFIQEADNKRNQFNFQDTGHGEKEFDGEFSLQLSVPRQMLWGGRKL